MIVQATELKTRLGQYLEAAIKEPVVIERSGRNTAVIISIDEYNRFLALEDYYWGMRAIEAEKEASVDNGLEFLRETVNPI
jgi:prevent-host-death family protein